MIRERGLGAAGSRAFETEGLGLQVWVVGWDVPPYTHSPDSRL